VPTPTKSPRLFHLIADLLSIASDPLEWTREKRKAETVAALIRLVVNQSTDVPILVVLEDAHWIDPSTEELFDEVVDRLQSLRILMVVTHRPEFQSSWSDHGHASQHSLNRLGRREAAEIVSMVAREELPESILNEIVAKTDGIPLFVEELTKAVLEAGLAEGRKSHGVVGSTVMIPATLHDSLMARLDRLDSAKEIAQIGACISREFSYQLIAALAPNDTPSLVEALDRLTDAELLYRRGRPPDATYSFKHALVQATAYQSLLKRRRKEIHSQIADVLLEQFGAIVEVEPELLGHHYSEAGRVELAITY
jgi:predicted ATPase